MLKRDANSRPFLSNAISTFLLMIKQPLPMTTLYSFRGMRLHQRTEASLRRMWNRLISSISKGASIDIGVMQLSTESKLSPLHQISNILIISK